MGVRVEEVEEEEEEVEEATPAAVVVVVVVVVGNPRSGPIGRGRQAWVLLPP
jgi:hypothetical protein